MRVFPCLLCCLLLACGGTDVGGDGSLGQNSSAISDGFDDPAGSGRMFLLNEYLPTLDNQLTWAQDIDDDGEPEKLVNVLTEQYQLLGYDFTEFVRSGSLLGVVELAGIEEPYRGEDSGVTAKIYQVSDGDQDITNNMCDGEGCAHFSANSEFMEDGQSIFRIGPTPIESHRMRLEMDRAADIPISLHYDLSVPFHNVRMEIELPDSLDRIPAGVACGAIPAWAMDQVPLCDVSATAVIDPAACAQDASLAFMLARLGAQPDIDLDGDGLERYDVDFAGAVQRCHDADGTVIEGASCLNDPRMADGFSMCTSFHGIPATLDIP